MVFLKQKRILLVTHSRNPGFSQTLLEWLKPMAKEIVYIYHPLLPAPDTRSQIRIYRGKRIILSNNSFKIYGPNFLIYLKDFFYTIYFVLKIKRSFDIGIGVDNLNTTALLILKKLGKIGKVIYHTVDYSPKRFENPFLNRLYHFLDRYSSYNSDILWNSSGRMNEARIKFGADAKRISKTVITPDGSNFDAKKRLPLSKIDRKKIVFLGRLRTGMGINLLISAFSQVIKKVKDAKLVIIGGGPLEDEVRKKIKEENLIRNVFLTGYIKSHSDVDEILKICAIGVAPFEPKKDSLEYFSDVGKPKAYLAAGLPVVITKVPEIAIEIHSKKAGFAINYKEEDMVETLLKLLENDNLFAKYRKNAILLSKKYIWSNIFEKAFSQTLKYFETEDKKRKFFESGYYNIGKRVEIDSKKFTPARKYEFEKFLNFLDLPIGSRVIELGAGYGRFVLPLAKLGYKVTAVDISEKLLQLIKKRARKFGIDKNLNYVNSNFEKPVFESHFDGAFCISTFHLLSDKEEERIKILSNLVKSVKSGGRVLVIEPNPLNPFYYPFYLFSKEASWAVEKNFTKSSEGHLRTIFRKFGLKTIEVRYVGFLPLRFIDIFPKISYFYDLIGIFPLLKKFSGFIYIRGIKK